MKKPRERSLFQSAWTESVKALRTNLLPGLLLQSVMAGMGAAYIWNTTARHLFQQLAQVRSEWGLIFSFIGTSVASAVFPELLRLVLPRPEPGSKKEPRLASRLLFGIPFWGLIGVQVDLFYRLQYLLFGPSETAAVIMKKVLVDSLV